MKKDKIIDFLDKNKPLYHHLEISNNDDIINGFYNTNYYDALIKIGKYTWSHSSELNEVMFDYFLRFTNFGQANSSDSYQSILQKNRVFFVRNERFPNATQCAYTSPLGTIFTLTPLSDIMNLARNVVHEYSHLVTFHPKNYMYDSISEGIAIQFEKEYLMNFHNGSTNSTPMNYYYALCFVERLQMCFSSSEDYYRSVCHGNEDQFIKTIQDFMNQYHPFLDVNAYICFQSILFNSHSYSQENLPQEYFDFFKKVDSLTVKLCSKTSKLSIEEIAWINCFSRLPRMAIEISRDLQNIICPFYNCSLDHYFFATISCNLQDLDGIYFLQNASINEISDFLTEIKVCLLKDQEERLRFTRQKMKKIYNNLYKKDL